MSECGYRMNDEGQKFWFCEGKGKKQSMEDYKKLNEQKGDEE